MSQPAERSLEDHWNSFAKRIELPTFKVVPTEYQGEPAIYVEFNLGQMTATFDSELQRVKFMALFQLRTLEILEGSPGIGRMFVGWGK